MLGEKEVGVFDVLRIGPHDDGRRTRKPKTVQLIYNKSYTV
jgi:hypothetical protein